MARLTSTLVREHCKTFGTRSKRETESLGLERTTNVHGGDDKERQQNQRRDRGVVMLMEREKNKRKRANREKRETLKNYLKKKKKNLL